MADHGATNHITPNNRMLYNVRPPSPENATVYIGDGTPLAVGYVGILGLGFHSNEHVHVTLDSVAYVRAMSVNLLLLHTVQANQKITLDATGIHLFASNFSEG